MSAAAISYVDGHWQSADGLKLHYRDYPGPAKRAPLLCLAGLTRNARDYANLAERCAGERRVLAVDFRGRGESAYAKDPMSYAPPVYAADVMALLGELAIERFVAVGTSLGGLVTVILAMSGAPIAGAVLNDVGPEIDPAGLERIKTYVGRGANYPTWLHAARGVAELNAHVYPRYGLADWLAMAKRLHRLTPSGRIVPDYDLNIAEPFRRPGGEAGVDLWPAFEALTGVPVLIVRGARSDVLSAATARALAERLPGAELVEVPEVGHAPTLDEPEAAAAIEALLKRV